MRTSIGWRAPADQILAAQLVHLTDEPAGVQIKLVLVDDFVAGAVAADLEIVGPLSVGAAAGACIIMTGIFTRWQPRYAEHGIATFPVDETKRPRIRGWQKVGLKVSTELASKFTDANALGYVTGRRSNVTVLDIDTTDEKVAEDAIRRHGQPAIVTRTASGKCHLLYRYNGERRRIRPWPELPIDLLGDNGYALAAPSKIATGSYEIIHGHLDDLDRLKPMAGAPSEAIKLPLPPKWSGMRQGDGRNRALWEHCMRTGAGCSFDGMLEIARNANESNSWTPSGANFYPKNANNSSGGIVELCSALERLRATSGPIKSTVL